VDLFLKEIYLCVALNDLGITFQNLHLQVTYGSVPSGNSLTELLDLVILQGKISLEILGQIHHLIHMPLLKWLVAVLGIHVPYHCAKGLLGHISN
jgi:hypothetical protein